MEYTKLKKTDITVSRICIGGCQFGGHDWGITNHEEMVLTLKSAIDKGINLIDTADIYGLGESERLISDVISHNNRSNIIVATKFGVRRMNNTTFYDCSPKWIKTALIDSLRRLNTDYIDLYQMHYWDRVTPVDEIMKIINEFKRKGYIRCFGISNIKNIDIPHFMPFIDDISSLQCQFSLVERNQEFADISEDLCVSPLTWGSLGQGILTGKYDNKSKFEVNDRRRRDEYTNFHGEKLEKNLKIVNELQTISKEINKPISAISIRWILDVLEDSISLVGMKNLKQLEQNILALDWCLSEQHKKILNCII